MMTTLGVERKRLREQFETKGTRFKERLEELRSRLALQLRDATRINGNIYFN